MALILPCRGYTPQFGQNCFLAENATIVGDVTMGDDCSVWFQAVVRGDVNFIRIGDKVNIQDGAILHGTYQKCGTTIGNQVSIGPPGAGAWLHPARSRAGGYGGHHYGPGGGGRKLPDRRRGRGAGKFRL